MSMVFPWFSLFKIFKTEISARNLFGTRGCGPCRGLLPGRQAVGQCLVGSNGARLGGPTLPGGAAAPGRGAGGVLWNPADGGSARRKMAQFRMETEGFGIFFFWMFWDGPVGFPYVAE